jgi:myo-inositol-1(or 4)-monophosphatase
MTNFLSVAMDAARKAGSLLREFHGTEHEVNEEKQFDIKLAIDVESQDLISAILLEAFPEHAIFGEEGISGDQSSPWQWVVDPIDGTVNYFYGIPHFCVSIALRHRGDWQLGVIYDPMMDEMFCVEKGGLPTLNGKPMKASGRAELGRAVVTVGFSKTTESMITGFHRFQQVSTKVRKVRIMGSAALAMAYVACGRLDAYIEEQISLWDIAAGHMLVESAGGVVALSPLAEPGKFGIIACNGAIQPALQTLLESKS